MNEQPVTPQNLAGSPYHINEIFHSIQGEGPWQGYPAVFIRFAGCNLQCTWCDTDYSNQRLMSDKDIYLEILKHNCKRVILTGGEPFAQDISDLVILLASAGFEIQIETNGTLSIPGFPFSYVTVVCSPKAGKINQDILEHCRDYKYVLGAEESLGKKGLPNMPTQPNGKRPPPVVPTLSNNIWIMPRDDQDFTKNEANLKNAVAVAMENNYRLCLQQHKILGVR